MFSNLNHQFFSKLQPGFEPNDAFLNSTGEPYCTAHCETLGKWEPEVRREYPHAILERVRFFIDAIFGHSLGPGYPHEHDSGPFFPPGGRRRRSLLPAITGEASTAKGESWNLHPNSQCENVKMSRLKEEEEEEEFITIGNWRGKHNSLLRVAGADQP